MRPELKAYNAVLSKNRREAAKAKADREKSFREGYAIAENQSKRTPGTILKGEVRISEFDVAQIPFSERYRYATDRLAEGFIKELKDYMTVDHINAYGGEIWKAELAVGKIVREVFNMSKLLRDWG